MGSMRIGEGRLGAGGGRSGLDKGQDCVDRVIETKTRGYAGTSIRTGCGSCLTGMGIAGHALQSARVHLFHYLTPSDILATEIRRTGRLGRVS